MDMMEVWHGAAMAQPHPVTLSGGLVHFQTDMDGLMQITGTGNITVCGRNLFDVNTLSAEYQYIDSSGNYVASNPTAGWRTTLYIPVSGLEKITYSGITTPGIAPYSAFFKADKSVHSTFKQATGTNTVSVPSGAAYVVFPLIQRQSGTVTDGNSFTLYAGEDMSGYAAYTGTTAAAGTPRKSLVGINNVWSDSGNITVTYWTH